MSFFQHIHDVLMSIIDAGKKIFTKDHIDKAVAIAKRVSDLIAVGAPYAQMLADAVLGGTPAPAILAAATRINLQLDQVLTNADAAARKGQLLSITGAATMDRLDEMLKTGSITIGDLTLHTSADLSKIPGDQIDAMAQLAYTLYVKPNLVKTGV